MRNNLCTRLVAEPGGGEVAPSTEVDESRTELGDCSVELGAKCRDHVQLKPQNALRLFPHDSSMLVPHRLTQAIEPHYGCGRLAECCLQ